MAGDAGSRGVNGAARGCVRMTSAAPAVAGGPLLGGDGYGGDCGRGGRSGAVTEDGAPILLAGSTLGTAPWTLLRVLVCGGRGP